MGAFFYCHKMVIFAFLNKLKWDAHSNIEKLQKWPDGIRWPKHFQKLVKI